MEADMRITGVHLGSRGTPSLHNGPASGPAARLVVPLRAEQIIWVLRFSDASMAWALEAARIWLLIFGCAAGGWALGFGMGYGRGVKDAAAGDIIRADHRVGIE
jgi:hypothetical protein